MKVFLFFLYVLLTPIWITLVVGQQTFTFITNIFKKLEELLGDVMDDIEFDIRF